MWILQATLAEVIILIDTLLTSIKTCACTSLPNSTRLTFSYNNKHSINKFDHCSMGCLIMLVNDKMSQMQNRVRHCKAANRYNSRLLIREQLNNIIDTWCFWFLSPFLEDVWCTSSYSLPKSIYLLLRVTIFHSATWPSFNLIIRKH